MPRYIAILPSLYPTGHQPLQDFVRANGLDPNTVAARPIIIQDGQLTVEVFEYDTLTDGSKVKRVFRDARGAYECDCSTVTVPLQADPSDFDL